MVAKFVMGRLTEASVFLRTLRVGLASPVFSLPTGCRGKLSDWTAGFVGSLVAVLRQQLS